jgi:hypothetical protein
MQIEEAAAHRDRRSLRDMKPSFVYRIRWARIGTELHQVLPCEYIRVSIYDAESDTFQPHCVDGESESTAARDPELPLEESDVWWVHQNQEPWSPPVNGALTHWAPAGVMEEWATIRAPSRPATSERDVLRRRLVRLVRHPLAGRNNAISVRSGHHMAL